MKKELMIMSHLILMLTSPCNSIDVYLRLLIDELIYLWKNGAQTYNKSIREMFTLQTVVIWTINDFSTFGMLSGWSTKSYMA